MTTAVPVKIAPAVAPPLPDRNISNDVIVHDAIPEVHSSTVPVAVSFAPACVADDDVDDDTVDDGVEGTDINDDVGTHSDGNEKKTPPTSSPTPSESFLGITGIFIFEPHPMDIYHGLDDAINRNYDLTFDLDFLFSDEACTTLNSYPVERLRKKLLTRISDQNEGDFDDPRG